MNQPKKLPHYLRWFVFILMLNYSLVSTAQCAGSDVTITVCDKFSDTNYQMLDLFSILTGEEPGGTWVSTDPTTYFALNSTTGILNLWEIHFAGIHTFTYTNNSCGESANVTIELGGYSGENNVIGDANACSDNKFVNLNPFLGDQTNGILPDANGIWAEDPATATGNLIDNIFNAEIAGPGTYIFTYTIGAVASCPESSTTIILKVHPKANSGISSGLIICNNEDFSLYTNVNLNELISGEDSRGTWSDDSSTNQISDLSDNIIDIQQIYNDFGVGLYNFTYSVIPDPFHPVCTEEFTTVNIRILPTLEGTMAVENYCISQDTFPVSVTYDNILLPDGDYRIEYSLSGAIVEETVVGSFYNGIGTFYIEKNEVPINSLVTLNIESLVGVCPTILVPEETFFVSDPEATATDSCVNTDVTVSLSNIFNDTLALSNQTYTVNYTIINPNNVDTNLTGSATFNNGASSFIIPGVNFPEGGTYDISLEIMGGLELGCSLSTSTTITPTPSEILLDLIVDDNCDATSIDVLIDAPILATGSYEITYDVVNQLTNTILTENSINFVGGTASYNIDTSGLPQGNYIVTVRSIQDDTTRCRIQFEYELQENFARGGIPNAPVADALQNFCLNNYGTSGPTLEDIAVTADGTVLFYESATDTNILPITTALVDGEDYFISNTDVNNNCEGSNRIQVVTTISNPSIPVALEPNPEYCAEENRNLSDLSSDIFNGTNIAWYDALTGGNLLDNTTTVENGISYFATTATTGGCTGIERLEIIPTVNSVEPASLEFTSLTLCGLDEPTVENLVALQTTTTNDVYWYDVSENGTPLNVTTPLVANTIYYAESLNPLTGCSNTQRIAVTINLTDCNPKDYGYFIPDGFSPNGDNRNDTFFVPNIGQIFPDYTIEIVNRYGNTLFLGDINNPAWDGTNNGNSTSPNGVYFYIINYNKEGFSPTQGRVYLNR